MTAHTGNGVLLFAGNGADRPLHQDRQVLRAGDLTLEQATQDAMLARARRHLHGWGIVAGFVPEVDDGNTLTIGAGYGVTPLGDELFLPQSVELPTAATAVVCHCGPEGFGCEVIDPDALAAARAVDSRVLVNAWLIARPASREAAPRPGVPEGCEHPASTLLPSRRCGGVDFAILCVLPPSHLTPRPECGTLLPFVCPPYESPPSPLPWEEPFDPADNFLVIARLTTYQGALMSSLDGRRRLLPVALIQDWIASCICPWFGGGDLRAPAAPPTDDEADVVVPAPDVAVVPPLVVAPPLVVSPPLVVTPTLIVPTEIEVAPGPPVVNPPVVEIAQPAVVNPAVVEVVAPAVAIPPAVEAVALPEATAVGLRERLGASVTEIGGVGPARATALAGIGVTTEGEFLTAAPDRLAVALKVPEAKVARMKEEVSARHDLGLSFR